MYSKNQFTALEAMCREQAALARSEMEYSLMKYWLVEAEEWKQLSTVPQALSEQRQPPPKRCENATGHFNCSSRRRRVFNPDDLRWINPQPDRLIHFQCNGGRRNDAQAEP
jgi:hypothetical protein